MNEQTITRRECLALGAACVFIGVLGIAWDSVVNEGHPAQEGEDDTEPP